MGMLHKMECLSLVKPSPARVCVCVCSDLHHRGSLPATRRRLILPLQHDLDLGQAVLLV